MTHWFWLIVIILTIVWYIIVTILVTIRGRKNIRDMIDELQRNNKE